MMKQFPGKVLMAMGLAIVAAGLLSCPMTAAGQNVVSNALIPNVSALDFSNPADPEVVQVEVLKTANTGYMLMYSIFDFNGTFSYVGSGSIPASSLNVSGGSVNAGKVMITLNVNTCDVTGYTTINGPCGTFNMTWVEVPASLGGSYAIRGNTVQTFPGGSKVVTNGEMVQYGASVTGSILDNIANAPPFGQIIQETNVTVNVTHP